MFDIRCCILYYYILYYYIVYYYYILYYTYTIILYILLYLILYYYILYTILFSSSILFSSFHSLLIYSSFSFSSSQYSIPLLLQILFPIYIPNHSKLKEYIYLSNNLSNKNPSPLLLSHPNIHSILVGTYIYLFIFFQLQF